jgi:hypothetical protein
MEDARPAPLPIAGQFDRDRRAPDPKLHCTAVASAVRDPAAYRSNAATD